MTHGCGAGGASRPSSRAAVDAVGRAGASPAMRSDRLDSAPSRDEAPQPRGGASDTLRLRRKRLPISRSRLTAACGQPDCRGHCRRHRRLAAAASSREHLKQLATVSAKALPARCAPRPMRSPARGAATASTSGSRRPLASVSSPLPVMPTQHNWKSIQGLVRNDGVELLSGRCELCAEAAVARGSVSRSFSPSGMPVAKCRTGCDVCKVHICQKCYRAGLFESYAHPGDCSGLGSSSVMMD